MEAVRAWKDPSFRRTLDQFDPARSHPAGAVALTEEELDTAASGGTITTSSWVCGATVASALTCPSLKATCEVRTAGCC